MKLTCFAFAFKYLIISTFLGKIGKYIKPCVGEGLCGTFERPNLVLNNQVLTHASDACNIIMLTVLNISLALV